MSKGNLFLGQARGKVGDLVFSRSYGEQIARSHNPSPKNPQSPLQMLQRICFNTASKAYSALQDICNHSFEGLTEGTPNQAEFIRLNTEFLRSQLALEISMPTEEVMLAAVAYNYNKKGDNSAELNQYVVSRGSLPSMLVSQNSGRMVVSFVNALSAASDEPTYAEVTEALGLRQGDQLTFCSVTGRSAGVVDGEFITSFKFARIILEPADGDMSLPFLSGSGNRFVVTQPNPRNEGVVVFYLQPTVNTLTVNYINRQENATQTPMLGTVIASRFSGSRWLRSSQSLQWLRDAANIPNADTFGDAYLTYLKGASSSLYLNQAGI